MSKSLVNRLDREGQTDVQSASTPCWKRASLTHFALSRLWTWKTLLSPPAQPDPADLVVARWPKPRPCERRTKTSGFFVPILRARDNTL